MRDGMEFTLTTGKEMTFIPGICQIFGGNLQERIYRL